MMEESWPNATADEDSVEERFLTADPKEAQQEDNEALTLLELYLASSDESESEDNHLKEREWLRMCQVQGDQKQTLCRDDDMIKNCVSLDDRGVLSLNKAIGPYFWAKKAGGIQGMTFILLARAEAKEELSEELEKLYNICERRHDLFDIRYNDKIPHKFAAVAVEPGIDGKYFGGIKANGMSPRVSAKRIVQLGQFLLRYLLVANSEDVLYIPSSVALRIPVFPCEDNPLVFPTERGRAFVRKVCFVDSDEKAIDGFFRLLKTINITPFPTSSCLADFENTQGSIQACQDILHTFPQQSSLYIPFGCKALGHLSAMDYHYSIIFMFVDFLKEVQLTDDVISSDSLMSIETFVKNIRPVRSSSYWSLGNPWNRDHLENVAGVIASIARKVGR